MHQTLGESLDDDGMETNVSSFFLSQHFWSLTSPCWLAGKILSRGGSACLKSKKDSLPTATGLRYDVRSKVI